MYGASKAEAQQDARNLTETLTYHHQVGRSAVVSPYTVEVWKARSIEGMRASRRCRSRMHG